ncbi:MAG: hypothetical protein RLZZ443_285 [Actinomycetota bacterium]
MGVVALQVGWQLGAGVTEQNQVAAGKVRAVAELVGRSLAVLALADDLGFVAEVGLHAAVEDVERALPQALVLEALAVANDAALDLVDLFEAAVDHDGRKNFATDSTGAVGHDWLVFEVVVLAAFELFDKVVSGLNIWHDGVLELADLRLKRVAAIEKDDLIAALFDELVDLVWLEVHAAVGHTAAVNLDLIRQGESDELLAMLDAQTRKIVAGAIAPLEVDLAETRVFASLAYVLLKRAHRTTEGSVDAVLRNQDAAF